MAEINYHVVESNLKGKEAEKKVAELYKKKGRNVAWTSCGGVFLEDGKRISQLPEELREVLKPGIPDLLLYDEIHDLDSIKFVEVKSSQDSLRLDQILWIDKFGEDFPVEVVHLSNPTTPLTRSFNFHNLKLTLDLESDVEQLKEKVNELSKEMMNYEKS